MLPHPGVTCHTLYAAAALVLGPGGPGPTHFDPGPPKLDKQMMELNTRFKPDTYDLMRRADTFGDKALIQPACTHFSIPVQDAEHTVFVQQLKRKSTNEKKETFSSLVEVLGACPRDIFPNMNTLLRALLTLPMTTCTVERLFSTVSQIKTGTRATVLADRLNSLSLLSFERELTDSQEYKDILAVFTTKPRRLLL